MASELRVNSSTNRSGLGTITYTDSGPIISGVGTFTNGFTVDGTQTTVKSLKLTGDNYNANWFKTTNKLRFNDNAKTTFGTSDDLQIYHTGSHSYIADEGVGELIISGSRVQLMNAARSGKLLDSVEGASGYLRLYQNNNIRLETTSTGVTISGTAVAGALDISGDIDVDGHTNLDNVSIAGFTTFAQNINVTGSVTGTSLVLNAGAPTIFLNDTDANSDFSIQCNGGLLKFMDTTNSYATRLSINSTGIVKVETSDSSSFNAHFLVNNSESNSGVSLIGSGSSFSEGGWAAVTDAGIIRSSANSSNGLVLQAASGDMRFYVGGNPPAERLRIHSDGDVSIGSASGDHRLTVKKDSSVTNFVADNDPAEASGMVLQNYSFSVGRYTALSFHACNSSSVQVASILGVSVSTGTAADLRFTVRDSNTSTAEVMRMGGHDKAFMVGTTNHRTAEFTHPDGFSIRGDTSKGQFQNTVTNVMGGLMNRDGSDGAVLGFRREGAGVGHIGVNASTMYLNFGGTTAAAHQLDDYETGTYTCTVYYSTVNTTGTHNNTLTINGYYEKIGNLVHISLSFTPSTYNSGNQAIITKFSLPFTPVVRAAAAFYRYSGAGHYGGMLAQSTQDDSGSYLNTDGFGYVIVGGTNQGSGFWGHHAGQINASGWVSGTYRVS